MKGADYNVETFPFENWSGEHVHIAFDLPAGQWNKLQKTKGWDQFVKDLGRAQNEGVAYDKRACVEKSALNLGIKNGHLMLGEQELLFVESYRLTVDSDFKMQGIGELEIKMLVKVFDGE